jgi:hypothetical protein
MGMVEGGGRLDVDVRDQDGHVPGALTVDVVAVHTPHIAVPGEKVRLC